MYAINIDFVLHIFVYYKGYYWKHSINIDFCPIFIYFLGWYGKWAVGGEREDSVDLGEGGGHPCKVLLLLSFLLLFLLLLA